MKLQSTKFILVLSILLLGFSACNKDDCIAPTISENIIGVWEVLGDEVEFKADGTFIDENDAVLGVGDMSTKTYTISEDAMQITAIDNTGSLTITVGFLILENECDEIKTMAGFGTTVTFKRK